jgi:hypothetical protein
MDAQTLATLVEAMIPIGAGVHFTLLGYRIIGKKPGVDPDADPKRKAALDKLKIFGPILVFGGGIFTMIQLLRRP